MKKKKKLTWHYKAVYVVAAILLLFILYRAYPDNPKVITSDALVGAAISIDDATEIVKDSKEYSSFDRLKRLVDIEIEGVRKNNPDDAQHYVMLQQNLGRSIDNDLYLAILHSSSRCLSTSYIVFYIDSESGDILRTVRWRDCAT